MRNRCEISRVCFVQHNLSVSLAHVGAGNIFAWQRPRGMPTLREDHRDSVGSRSYHLDIPDYPSRHRENPLYLNQRYELPPRPRNLFRGAAYEYDVPAPPLRHRKDLPRQERAPQYVKAPTRPRPPDLPWIPVPDPLDALPTLPLPSPTHHAQMHMPSQSSAMDVDLDSQPIVWDGFPDGHFSHLFTLKEARELDNLMVHWAFTVLGGKPNQSATSETWQGGKTTRRQCLGTIECSNDDCRIIIRPQSTLPRVSQQLSKDCHCGASLFHKTCPVISTLYTFKHGVYYVNGGKHEHAQSTHRLHLSQKERHNFEEIVHAHPRDGPLKLLVGLSGANGPGKSVAEISPVLINAGRIKHEKRQALGKGNGKGPDGTIAEFAAFEKAHPGFIRQSSIGEVTVITMQTPFMAELLVKDHRIENEAVNGIVSDATHSYFADPKALLFMSSIFSVSSRYWVPGLISYSNGATTAHYRLHFLQLIVSVIEECRRRGIEFTNEMLANVRLPFHGKTDTN